MTKFIEGDEVRVSAPNLIKTRGTIQEVIIGSAGHARYILGDVDKEGVYLGYEYGDHELEIVKTVSASEGGTKFDAGKPDLSLVDKTLVNAAARALMFGAKKYGRDNYKQGIELNRIYASLLRHLFARMGGEFKDPESGLDHIDHIAANVQFLAYFTSIEKTDDLS